MVYAAASIAAGVGFLKLIPSLLHLEIIFKRSLKNLLELLHK
jgi:myo-inositol-1-phosphate synthase